MSPSQFIAYVTHEFCRAKCEGPNTRSAWLMGARWLFGYHGEHVIGPARVCIGRTVSEGADSYEWYYDMPDHRVLVHIAAHDAPHLLCYAEVDYPSFCSAHSPAP